MKATEAYLLDLIKKSDPFAIPIFQRTYSWTEQECDQLWEDILRAGRRDDISVHFIGSIVYIQQPKTVTGNSPLLVIDGQQRLTTVMLLLEALARRVGDTEPVEGFSAKKIRNYYLVNDLETGDKYYKLLLTQTDRASLKALVRRKPWPDEHSIRIKENFEFFEKRIKALKDDLAVVCRGIQKLMIVDIALFRPYDNPQLIFESMNSTGRELTQADLIRNYILMGLDPDHQEQLYKEYWRPMEIKFGQKAYTEHFDRYMRHFLTLKSGEIPNIRDVYEAFKKHSLKPKVAQNGIDALVSEIKLYADYYCAMALGLEKDKFLESAFRDLRELKVDTAYPLLLELYHDYKTNVLSRSDFLKAVRLIEAYVFRRAVCAIPTASLNKTFANFGKSLQKYRYLQSIEAQFLLMPSYRRFPDDDEFRRELKLRDLYNFRSRSYWLRRLENYGTKETVPVDEYTIEHIMPQNLSLAWQNDLGPEWERVHKEMLHTIGNLTLTGYNSEYSNLPFDQKRDRKGGFKESPLQLNKGLGMLHKWDELAILSRADRLVEIAVQVWKAPKLDRDTLATYQPVSASATYTINDHPFLKVDPVRDLFEAFRKEVLALDPVVTEEFLKYYVAYKAETNFVDIVPQKSRLRLSLNMPFHELSDPKGIARDITKLGKWGNGDVEIGLNTLGELPYVLGLVRQAFERQMGNGDSEA